MKLLDVNVWLALALSKHQHHAAARVWLDGEQARESLHFCRATQQSLVRLLSTSHVLARYGNAALTNREAWEVYERFTGDDRVVFATEPVAVEAVWSSLSVRDGPSPKLWMDAYLAAFAIAGQMRLVTLDHDFKAFENRGLDLLLLNP